MKKQFTSAINKKKVKTHASGGKACFKKLVMQDVVHDEIPLAGHA